MIDHKRATNEAIVDVYHSTSDISVCVSEAYLDLRRLVKEHFDASNARAKAEQSLNVASDNFTDDVPEMAVYMLKLEAESMAEYALRAAIGEES